MKKFVNAMFVLMAGAVFAAPDLGVTLPRRPKDGMGDVSRASGLGAEGKWDEGRKFVAELRARPTDGRNLEERQSVDMAEFALLRHDLKANKARAVECLKAVYDAGSTSFWGWAAYSYLKELGVDVPAPPKDPLRGVGAFGDGVVNPELARRRIEACSGELMVDGTTAEVGALAERLLAALVVPKDEVADAYHIATAAVHGMDVLLTWNCRHMANRFALPKTISVVTAAGYACPAIVTPEDFLKEELE